MSILPRYEYQYNSELGTAHYDSFDVEAVNNELSFIMSLELNKNITYLSSLMIKQGEMYKE